MITTSAPAESEPRDTVLRLKENGNSMGGWVAIRRRDDAVDRHYVPKEGLEVSLPADGAAIRYVNTVSTAKKNLWRGENKLADVEHLGKDVVVQLTKISGRMVTIKALAEDGTPLAHTRLEINELWDGHEVSVAGGNTDDAGTMQFYLADNNVYRARVRWKHSPVASESKTFKTKDLKNSQFTFTPAPPAKTCFAIQFVIAEGNRKRPATNIRGIEILSDKQGILAAVFDGRVLIRLDGNEDFRVQPGDKIRLRLGSDKYEIQKPVVAVGKEGTSIEVKLVPIKKTQPPTPEAVPPPRPCGIKFPISPSWPFGPPVEHENVYIVIATG